MAKNKNLARIDLKNIPIATKRILYHFSKEENLTQSEAANRAILFYNKWLHGGIDLNNANTQAINQLTLVIRQLAQSQKGGFGTIIDILNGLVQIEHGPQFYSHKH